MFSIKIPFVIATHVKRYSTLASLASAITKQKGLAIGGVGKHLFQGYTTAADYGSVTDGVASNGGTVTAVEFSFGGWLHRTVFTLTATPLTLADATVGAGTKIYDFPKGVITILGAAGGVAETTTSVLASTLNASVTYNWGVGTVTQANGTLATTEQDIVPTTNGTASATINVAGATSKGIRTAAPVQFNGSATATDAYFNVGIATATDIDADATTTWTGVIVVDWMINTAGN